MTIPMIPELARWRITAHAVSRVVAYVEAATADEALAIARELSPQAWDFDDVVSHDVLSAEATEE